MMLQGYIAKNNTTSYPWTPTSRQQIAGAQLANGRQEFTTGLAGVPVCSATQKR